jgi:hypothetical protein
VTTQRYPLEALLRLRRHIRDEVQQQLARALEALNHAERARQNAAALATAEHQRLGLQQEKRRAEPGSTVAAAEQRFRYEQFLTAKVAQAEQGLRQATAEKNRCATAVGSVQQALIQAETELKLVTQHFEQWDLSRREEEQRRAELELEDLVLARSSRERC